MILMLLITFSVNIIFFISTLCLFIILFQVFPLGLCLKWLKPLLSLTIPLVSPLWMTFITTLQRKSEMVVCQAHFLVLELNRLSAVLSFLPPFWSLSSLRPRAHLTKSICAKICPKPRKPLALSTLIFSWSPSLPVSILLLVWLTL